MSIAISLVLYAGVFFLLTTGRRIGKPWYLFLGLTPLFLIYILNPNHRVYSFHGFIHAGIVYQILNGNIPPQNPFLAGQPLFYYWGFHYANAVMSRALNLSPFYSFAIYNTACLGITMVAIYKLSSLLVRNERTGIFCVLTAIFGTSVLTTGLKAITRSDYRGIPLFKQFSNIGGITAGIAAFFLFLLALARICAGKRIAVSDGLLFSAAVLGCGFLYPGYLLSLAVITVCACFVLGFVDAGERRALWGKKLIILTVILIVATLMLSPYLASVSQGIRKQVVIDPVSAVRKAANFAVIILPMSLVLFAARKPLKETLDRKIFFVIATAAAVNLAAYILMHLPGSNECKFMSLSVATIGVIGGAAFYSLMQRRYRFITCAVLFFFLLPSLLITQRRTARLAGFPAIYKEKGTTVNLKGRKRAVYHYIQEKTPTDSVFVDSTLAVPVFGQRSLYLPVSDKHDSAAVGYRTDVIAFLLGWGSESEVVERRMEIVKDIYDPEKRSFAPETEDFFSAHENIYIIVRKRELGKKFERKEFREVMTLLSERIRIFTRVRL